MKRVNAAVFSYPRNNAVTHEFAEQKSSEIARMLKNEQWSQLRQQFNPFMRLILTETLLKKGFAALRMTSGPIVHIGKPRVAQGWLTTAKVPVEFRRMKMGMSIVLTPFGGLLSLKFWPQNVLGFGAHWTAPPYAPASSSFREIKLEIGPQGLRTNGILTLPAGSERYPCIIMLSGSGPCDQDSAVGSTKPLKDVALGLAARDIASLRFDKVTKTHGRKIQARNTFTLQDEYVDHAKDALRQVFDHESVSTDSVFILGHSLGAVVAPGLMAADPRIAGCIIMAGPASCPGESLLRQLRYLASLDESEDEPNTNEELHRLQRQCELSMTPDLSLTTPRSDLPLGIGAAYWRSFGDFHPINTCRDYGRPVLVLQGGRDYQVTVEDDFQRWRAALTDNRHVEMQLYEDLNHLFISGTGQPSPKEYDDGGNVDRRVIQDISKWNLEARKVD